MNRQRFFADPGSTQQAASHPATPLITWLDSLGR
jgi:hypothetical protein